MTRPPAPAAASHGLDAARAGQHAAIPVRPTGPSSCAPPTPAPTRGQWPGGVADPGERPRQLAGIGLDPEEHDEVRVLTAGAWRELMPARDHARLEAVMAARRTGTPAYFDTWDWEV